ncbi:MAG: hypothetical protein ABFD07_17495, partial [Methanobacterium sp.]
MTNEKNLETRIDYIKDMAHVLGFPIITDGNMDNYRYLKFEDSNYSKKKMITIYARIYSDSVHTELIFKENKITFSRDIKMKLKEVLDLASMVDGLYDWLND